MRVLQTGDHRIAESLRRRGVLLGLTAAHLQRVAAAFGLKFSWMGGLPAFADTIVAQSCDQPLNGAANWMKKRRDRIAQALRSGFGVQYWGKTFTADHLAANAHGMLIIETAKIGASAADKSREVFFTRDEIKQIGQDRHRPVLGYLNVAKIEPYRDYWVDALGVAPGRDTLDQADAPWIGPSLEDDGTLARFWTPEWLAILTVRVDCLLAQGVDGVFLDDVLQYFAYYSLVSNSDGNFPESGGPATAGEFARAMMSLVIAIADRVRLHDCRALVVVNNGAYIGRDAGVDPAESPPQGMFDRYRAALDGILIESVFADGGNAAVINVLHEDFASVGLSVLTIDFADTAEKLPLADFRSAIGARAATEGFASYVADDAAFNRLFPPIPIAQIDPVLP